MPRRRPLEPRETLCQTGASLDMGRVLEDGSILLVTTATEGTQIAEEDATTFGSILMTDLWTAARRRGKREEGMLRPAYCYVDEFQNFVSPAIAAGLAEASGFGIHLTLAHQYPSQLTDKGEIGKMILNSVLANAKNKICFQLSHPDDLEMLAQILFRQHVDPDKIKSEIYSTKTMDHRLVYLPSTSTGSNTVQTQGEQTSRTDGTSVTHTDSRSHTDGTSDTTTISDSLTEGESDSINYSQGRSGGRGSSVSEQESSGSNSGEQFAAEADEPYGRTAGESASRGKGRAENTQEGWSAGSGGAHGTSSARTTGFSESHGVSSSDTYGESDSRGISVANTKGQSSSLAVGESSGISWSPMLMPIMGKELSSRQFVAIQEQLFKFAQFLDGLPDRHCVVRRASDTLTHALFTHTIRKALASQRFTAGFVGRSLGKLAYVLPMTDALARIADRERAFVAAILDGGLASSSDPTSAKRVRTSVRRIDRQP